VHLLLVALGVRTEKYHSWVLQIQRGSVTAFNVGEGSVGAEFGHCSHLFIVEGEEH
jgi:hypothetical protein